eukprot:m.352687 g.352687  ORF g.352687 m.352687 type:complete len:172 (+) comp19903_c11_seq1:570-1085(+)
MIQDVEYREAASTMLCAALSQQETDFNDEIHDLYPNRFFFSDGFRSRVGKDVAARRGAAGMPDALAPEVPLGVLQQLQRPLPDKVTKLVEQNSSVVRAACERLLCKRFADFPVVQNLVQAAVQTLLDQQHRQASTKAHELLDWEAIVLTKNHYFMDTVQDLRKSLLQPSDA